MEAFFNSKQIQSKFVKRLENHFKMDEIIKGQYWENGKGCAIGCTIHSSSHNCYELELGIPVWIAKLEDTLFERMPNEKAKEFPLKLLKSIPLGFSNWQHIYHQISLYILQNVCINIDNPLVMQAICDIITLHKKESKDESAWSAARSAATKSSIRSVWSDDAAARSAESAAWSAAWSAADWFATRSAQSARSAAESAAWSAAAAAARSATWSAAWSAESATWSAESAARSDESAARSAAYYDISKKLINLLENEELLK